MLSPVDSPALTDVTRQHLNEQEDVCVSSSEFLNNQRKRRKAGFLSTASFRNLTLFISSRHSNHSADPSRAGGMPSVVETIFFCDKADIHGIHSHVSFFFFFSKNLHESVQIEG